MASSNCSLFVSWFQTCLRSSLFPLIIHGSSVLRRFPHELPPNKLSFSWSSTLLVQFTLHKPFVSSSFKFCLSSSIPFRCTSMLIFSLLTDTAKQGRLHVCLLALWITRVYLWTASFSSIEPSLVVPSLRYWRPTSQLQPCSDENNRTVGLSPIPIAFIQICFDAIIVGMGVSTYAYYEVFSTWVPKLSRK